MATPARRGIRRGFLAIALFAFTCLALIAWSHLRWTGVLAASLEPLQVLAQSQRSFLRAELYAERLRAADATVTPLMVSAELESALREARVLGNDASTPDLAVSAGLRQARLDAARRYREALQELQRGVLARPGEYPTEPALALRAAHGGVSEAAMALELAVHRELAERRNLQAQLTALTLLLVGALAAALMWQIAAALATRERASARLAANEARLAAMVAALPEVSFVLDAQGRYLSVYGPDDKLVAPREDLLGQSVSRHMPAEQAARVLEAVDQALRSGQPARTELQLVTPRGLRCFEGRAASLAGEAAVVWISWDITERKAAEQRVQVLSRLYSFLGQVNQAIVQVRDEPALFQRICNVAISHGHFRLAWIVQSRPGSHVAERVAGAGEAVAGELMRSLVRIEDTAHPACQAMLQRVTCWAAGALVVPAGPHDPSDPHPPAGESLDLVALPLTCQGQCDAALLLAHARLDPADRDEQQLFTEVAADIAFARAQFVREAAWQAAQARVRLNAAALESTQDGVMVTDLHSVIVSVNRAFTEITGYTEQEVLGTTPRLLHSGLQDQSFYKALWKQLSADGHWHGEIWNQRKNGQLYAQWMSISTVRDDLGQPTHFVAVFTDTTVHKLAEERLQHMAHYDPLTELPNRPMVLASLEHAIAAAGRLSLRVAVLFIDLDNFKTVNDSLGHDAGDRLLAAVAQRLSGRTRREDTLGRLGGDEFVLVMENLRDAADAGQVAQELIGLLDEPFRVGETPVYVQASIGISIFPEDGSSVGELVRDADAAMYQAKRAGRNTYRYYTEALTAAAHTRLALDNRLRRAMERGEFELWYQPLYRLADRRLIGLEALVRLHQPDLPPVGPAVFIPVLEESGQIIALGSWVTREACRQGRAWLDAGLDFGRIAVNLSPVEVRRGGTDERLRAALAETGLPADRLELEITESGLMEQGEHAEAFLRSLHAQGVQLAIDDFGTGYSSLAYLKRFPVSKLKIDRSFITDLPGDANDAQLVRTMVTLGHSLGLAVVAEGVETPGQFDFLNALGCGAAQGFLFSAPRPAGEARAWLQPLAPTHALATAAQPA